MFSSPVKEMFPSFLCYRKEIRFLIRKKWVYYPQEFSWWNTVYGNIPVFNGFCCWVLAWGSFFTTNFLHQFLFFSIVKLNFKKIQTEYTQSPQKYQSQVSVLFLSENCHPKTIITNHISSRTPTAILDSRLFFFTKVFDFS